MPHLSLISYLMSYKKTGDYVKTTPYLVAAVKDRRKLVHHLSEKPTPLQILVSEYPNNLHYTYACQLEAGGGDYTMNTDHTALCMEICMATRYSKKYSVLKKSKRYIDDKKYRISGISSWVDGAGICGGGSDV